MTGSDEQAKEGGSPEVELDLETLEDLDVGEGDAAKVFGGLLGDPCRVNPASPLMG